MSRPRLLPSRLADRFALASSALAAVAVLLVSLASWWLIAHQQTLADRAILSREQRFHADNVGSTLRALSSRMSEIAGSTILATGLVDSAGKETYLSPYLNGIRQINGIPVQVLFADFEGKEIAANATARFNPVQMQWLRRHLPQGKALAEVLSGDVGPELVALEPLRYSRTRTPEGAVIYKIALRDINLEPSLYLTWGDGAPGEPSATLIPAPPVFAPVKFRVSGQMTSARSGAAHPQYLAIALIAAAVFCAVFLAGARLARLLTRDLSRLEAFSSKVTSAALIEQRAPEGGTLEVASVASSINKMLQRLHDQHQALLVEGEKLGSLAEALKTADRRKDEFLAMLAHELRNPLAPIATGAELLRRISGADARAARTIDVISRQASHMTKLIDDLLDVSRVTRGLVALELANLDARNVVSAAVDQLKPQIDARRHRLLVDMPAQPLPVVGDEARLVQVMSNLLHNACKFTPDGGEIRVSAQLVGGEVVLQVCDNGSGIAPGFLPDVFGLFTQGSRQPDRSQGGLGLGLALVKHLVELHDGRVSATSDGLGRGATFTVTLPAAEPVIGEAPGAPQLTPPSGSRLAVMVVDDNIDAAQTLSTLLELEGHDVVTLFDPVKALARAAVVDCDVFILDIGLPGMDGIELARRIRALPGKQRSVLVALTGYGQAKDRQQSAAAGFDHHFVKPVDAQALAKLLKSVRPL